MDLVLGRGIIGVLSRGTRWHAKKGMAAGEKLLVVLV